MLLAILVSVPVLALCTLLHYAALKWVSDRIAHGSGIGAGLGFTVGAITLAHVIEALIYALAFLFAVRVLAIGDLEVPGPEAKDLGLMEYFYFSLVNFTTLGRGDLMPQGHLRFLTGIEAFHGFLMITASGSFTLQVMAGRAPLSRQ